MNRRLIQAGVTSGIFTAALFALPIYFSLNVLQNYGWWLLVGVPFGLGIVVPNLMGADRKVSHNEAFAAAMVAVGTILLIILAFLWEGLVCLIMAGAPALLLVLLGVAIGHPIQNWRVDRNRRMYVTWVAVAVPFGLAALSAEPTGWDRRTVKTEVWMAAPPEKIWPLVLNCEGFGQHHFWLFNVGIAHPVGTRTVGNDRVCILSTGEMPERITRRTENRRLSFEVLHTPPALREMNPFGDVLARHDETVYRSFTGDWQLIPERGGTRVVATSVYGHRLGANEYWRLWTDEIVHQVHWQVFDHIKAAV